MHDLDRSDLVFEADRYGDEVEELAGDAASEDRAAGQDDEADDVDDAAELDGDLADELADDLADDLAEDEAAGVFGADEQAELAGELLAVSGDRELDHFLDKLMKRAARRLRPLRGRLANNLGSLLKGAVRTVLPAAAGLAGGPVGAMIAGRVAPRLDDLLGAELEGLSPEDQELEAAKQLVRLAGAAIENAADLAAAPGASPAAAARQAVIAAARRHAPGLVRETRARHAGRPERGTWYRRGDRIVIVGV